jgi:hypothetical protein
VAEREGSWVRPHVGDEGDSTSMDDEPIRIDPAFLVDVGLARLPPGEAQVLLRHVYETLEWRVGAAIAEHMTQQQLDEFETYFVADDSEGALAWLERNFPNYKQVVRNEFKLLHLELRQIAPTILALSGMHE